MTNQMESRKLQGRDRPVRYLLDFLAFFLGAFLGAGGAFRMRLSASLNGIGVRSCLGVVGMVGG